MMQSKANIEWVAKTSRRLDSITRGFTEKNFISNDYNSDHLTLHSIYMRPANLRASMWCGLHLGKLLLQLEQVGDVLKTASFFY